MALPCKVVASPGIVSGTQNQEEVANMSSHYALFVVAAGAVDHAGEQAVAKVVDAEVRKLGALGGPVSRTTRISVFPTGRGVVEIEFEARGRNSPQSIVTESLNVARRHMLELGCEVLDTKPEERIERPPIWLFSEALKRLANAEPTPESDDNPSLIPEEGSPPPGEEEPLDAEVLDAVLLAMADHSLVSAEDIAQEIDRSVEVVQWALKRLAKQGLVSGSKQAVFSLTKAGESLAAANKGGRKAIVKALLESEEPLTVRDLTQHLGCTETVIKRSIKMLIDEGMVEVVGKAKTGAYRPSRLYSLTDYGRRIGSSYVPPNARIKSGWGEPTDKRLAVIRVLLGVKPAEGATTLPVSTIAWKSGVPARAVHQMMMGPLEVGYVEREVISEAPRAYGYGLTLIGRQMAQEFVDEHTQEENPQDPAAPASVKDAVPAAEQSAVSPQFAYNGHQGVPRVYKVTVVGDIPDVPQLLEWMNNLGGVTVEPMDAS